MKKLLKEYLTPLVVILCFVLLGLQQSCNERKLDNLRNELSERIIGSQEKLIRTIDSTITARKDTALYLTRNIHHIEANRDSTLDRIRNIHSVDSLIAEYYRVRPE